MIQLPKHPIIKELELHRFYKRIVVIGDVHGCYDEMCELLDKPIIKSSIQDQDGKLIFLGDLIDRGPNSRDCLIKALDLSIFGYSEYILGNHEEKHLRYFEHQLKGGKNPMKPNEEFLKVHNEIKECEFALMAELPAAIKWENFIFTHAGVIPGLMFNQPLKGFIRNRYIEPRDGKWIFSASWQGEDGDWKHMPQAVHWSEAYNGNETIVYGHEPRKDIHTVNKTIGIDTGCCFNGKLSAMIIDKETKEYTFEQVQAKQVYHKE